MAIKFKDYYQTLGVERTAKTEDIQRAFRKLARKYHPDVNKSPEAEERFKEINEAYEVLRDQDKRRRYDALGMNWKAGQEFTPPPGWEGFPFSFDGGRMGDFADVGGFSDFFRTLFGGGLGGRARAGGPGRAAWSHRGRNTEAEMEITLAEAAHGAVKKFQLETLAPRPDGALTTERKSYDVTIPPGVTDGSKIRLGGQGEAGMGGGPPGDLLLRLRLRPDPRFTVHGHDLRASIDVAPWEAALGAEARVPTLSDPVMVRIPPGTQSGQTLRLRGQGLPRRHGDPGDLLVTVRIAVPKTLTDRERELFEALARESPFKPRSG